MARGHSFHDQQFGGSEYDPTDRGTFDQGTVFVVMAFKGQDTSDVYTAIKDACKTLRLGAIRVDETPGSGIVIKKITQLIEQSEFIIVDLTHERPNVYYELGYAHGVGNEDLDILLIAKDGTELHFDIAPLAVKFYKSIEDLQRIVLSGLEVMIKETR